MITDNVNIEQTNRRRDKHTMITNDIINIIIISIVNVVTTITVTITVVWRQYFNQLLSSQLSLFLLSLQV